ncbi:DNA cytosine methyltransferase [Tissierella sp. Yu-01]|uniref:DNA cytosine methyltransferase n=1 Tax=Tissierella sp. Yu-01 TaxID=3035694 RepID=UPI00240D87B7|nr:DNA cytosine methyltransferase [Tissierella sp. Yu-01]WFA09516.1 DNA cytosine methyltransferase [Tissierella sp. Yu-01]
MDREKINEYIKDCEIDLIVGGPPCQVFSIFGKRRFINTQGYNPKDDPRNYLVYEYIRVVNVVRPKFFIMENVKGFTSLDNGLFVDEVIKEFNKIGYRNIKYGIFRASDYGVPQHRERMIMIGTRLDLDIELPEVTHGEVETNSIKKFKTVGEAIMDLVNMNEDGIENHVPLKHKPIVQERMSYIKEGQKLNVKDVPEHLLIPTRKDMKHKKITNFSHVYRRLHREECSITLVPGHNAFPVHPTLNRTLTVREAARIQSFPDSHTFTGNRQQQCIQVGNAIPPLMAKAFIEKVKEQLNQHRYFTN